MLAPEKMTGWPDPPRAEERPFIAPAYRDLPALGRLAGRGGTANLEVVLKAKPDLILDFGSVRGTYVSLADNVQEQTKLPYILIDGAASRRRRRHSGYWATSSGSRRAARSSRGLRGGGVRGDQTRCSSRRRPRSARASTWPADPTGSRPA